eukprot:6195068-Pleurochrysis_carterae.AAC.3
MQSLLALALLLVACAQALLVPARVPATVSRTCSIASRVLMCDGEAAAPEPAAAAPAEASADEGTQQRRRPREPRTPIEELTVGSTVEGTIRSVQSYGAFVNVGKLPVTLNRLVSTCLSTVLSPATHSTVARQLKRFLCVPETGFLASVFRQHH